MSLVSVVGDAAVAWWGLALSVHAISLIAAFIQPSVRRRAAWRKDKPGVSVVIPLKDVEPELDAAFTSVFAQTYPDFEVLIGAAEETSPAIDVARQVASRFPTVACRFMLGNKRFTLNPKISNISPALTAAKHDLILIKDANICLADGQLGELVANLTPGTGMVCAVPIGVRPQSFFADIECAMMNGHAAPLLMAASILRLDIGFGKVMLFARRDFNRVDGIAITASTFGDDHALAKALARIGLRTVFSAGVIRQPMGPRDGRKVWNRQLRWMMIRRGEEPLAFIAEPFFSAGFATAVGIPAGLGLGIAWWILPIATLVFWGATEAAVVAPRHWGWSWRYPLAALCRELLIVALWLRAWSSRKVVWAGQSFNVDDIAPDGGGARG